MYALIIKIIFKYFWECNNMEKFFELKILMRKLKLIRKIQKY